MKFESHDLHLPDWGPYTKQYSGISHVPAVHDGTRFDLAVFPGLFRRRVEVPNVRFEGPWHVWQAAPDLSCYTIRHELEWKDKVYADISFLTAGEQACLIRAELHNDSPDPQDLVLHYAASAHDPTPSGQSWTIPGADIRLPDSAVCVNVMELLVDERLDRYVRMFGLCTCPRCLADVRALSLTRLPPKYVVLPGAYAAPMISLYRAKFESQVIAQVIQACKTVMEHPRHGA